MSIDRTRGKVMHYLALVFRDDVQGYGFTVPDIPGFTAHAENAGLDAALAVARRTLADHLAALVDAGLPIPEARAPEDVIEDPEVQEDLGGAVASILLPAILPAGRTLRINITIDEATLALIDRAAADRNLTRSAFMAEASRRFADPSAAVETKRQRKPGLVAQLEQTQREIQDALDEAAGTRGALRSRARR
jgi:predicted RNase H-like HicB family nuclease